MRQPDLPGDDGMRGDLRQHLSRWLQLRQQADQELLEILATIGDAALEWADAAKAQRQKLEEGQYLLTVERVAQILACSSRHVYTLINSGGLPAVRPAGIVRIAPAALEQFIADHSSRPLRDMGDAG